MTDYKSTIAELHYLADWAKHHLDKAKIANDAADAIEALQGENERLEKANKSLHEYTVTVNEKVDALAAELATLKAQGPVGFVAPHDLKTLREGYPATVVMLPSNKRTEPLFAAPKALAPEPLTDEKISLMAHNEDEGDWNDLRYRDCWHKGYKAGARASEAEHGIGGTP